MQCKFTARTMNVLKLHLENDHGYDFQCAECGKKFPFKNQLKLHRREVHEEGSFSCFVCNKNFMTHKELKQHIQKRCKTGSNPITAKIVHKHNDDILEEDEHKCPKCPKITNNQVSLLNHMNTKHSETKEMCVSCGELFKTREELVQHVSIKHNVDKEKCESCGKEFENRNVLIKHIVDHHTVNGIHVINRHICKLCKVEVHGEAARDSHECKKPEHTCSYCKMSFHSTEARQNHICERHEFKTVDEQLRSLKRKNTECRNGINCYRAMRDRCWFKHSQPVNVLSQQVQVQSPDHGQWQSQGRRQGQRQDGRNKAEWICQVCEKKFVSREEKFNHIGRVHENIARQTSSVSHLWCQYQDKCTRKACRFKHFVQGFQKENVLQNRQ